MTQSDPANHIDDVLSSHHHLTNFTLFQLGNYTLSDLIFEPRDTVSHHRIWPYFFWVTFVVGLIGNGLVVFVYFRKKQIRTVTNTYLINLAITDVLYLLSTIPNKAVLMDNWPFGELMCKLISYLQNVTMTVGILTLTVVGMDRHYALLYPISSRKHRTIKGAVVITVILWVISYLMNCSTFLVAQKIQLPAGAVCLYIWDELWGHKAYSVSMFVLLFVVPQLILIFCYYRIGHRMWCSANTVSGSEGQTLRKLLRGRRVVKMVIAVTVMFFICWFPIYCSELMVAFGSNFTRTFHEFKLLSPMIPHLCIATNPFIYNFMSTTFHAQFKEMVVCSKADSSSHSNSDVVALNGKTRGNFRDTLEIPLKNLDEGSTPGASPLPPRCRLALNQQTPPTSPFETNLSADNTAYCES